MVPILVLTIFYEIKKYIKILQFMTFCIKLQQVQKPSGSIK